MDIPAGGSFDQEQVFLHQEDDTFNVLGFHALLGKEFFNNR